MTRRARARVAAGVGLVAVSAAGYRGSGGPAWGLVAAPVLSVLVAVLVLAVVKRSSHRIDDQRPTGELYRGVAIFDVGDLIACEHSRPAAEAAVPSRLTRTRGRVQGLLSLTSDQVRFVPDDVAAAAGIAPFAVPVADVLAVSATAHIGKAAHEVELRTRSGGTLVGDLRNGQPLVDRLNALDIGE